MPRRERIFWLFVGAALVVGFIALIPAHGEICKEAEKAQQESCTTYSLVPFLVIKIGKILDALGVAITALATIAIAWFTLSLRRSTDRLWDAGERQLALLAQTSAAQSRDMQASVAIAESGVLVSREIGEAQVRAYLSCESATYILNGSFVACKVFFRNHGQSPAISTAVEARTVTLVPSGDRIGGLSYVRSEVASSNGPAIAAGQCGEILVMFLHGFMGIGAHEAIWKGSNRFDVRGHVRWRDVFGKAQEQTFYLDLAGDDQIYVPETERSGEMTPENHASEDKDFL